MSFWVAGTDTSVGKTVVSALVLARYAGSGPLAYWKPISTGGDTERDRRTLESLAPDGVEVLEETYHFELPVSPHLAARAAGGHIDREKVLEELVRHGLENRERNLVIEGAGGLLVPLDDDDLLLVQLMAETSLPVLLVARSTLGTINHTLLSLEALRSRGIEIAGVVLNGPANPENRRAIERHGRVRIVSEVLPLVESWRGFHAESPPPSRRSILEAARSFDPGGVLEEYLGGTAS